MTTTSTPRAAAHGFAKQTKTWTDTQQEPEIQSRDGAPVEHLDKRARATVTARNEARDKIAAIRANKDLTPEAQARQIKTIEQDVARIEFEAGAAQAEEQATRRTALEADLFSNPKGIDGDDYRAEVRRLSGLDSKGLQRAVKLATAANDKVTLRAALLVAHESEDSLAGQALLGGPLASLFDSYAEYLDLSR